ncbi:MAG: PIN domain-containing protein [Planctomycetia bacterium]|nr:PIN domain-containing protein [Planctomycetia bacterium]
MNAVDTNVLIYRLDRGEPDKQALARRLLRQLTSDATPTVLLWQVAGELVRQLRKWQDEGRLTRNSVLRFVAAFRKHFPLMMPTAAVLDRALELTGRHSLSHWDSMVLAACLEANVDTLYTEDMGAPTVYDGLRLINPFV